MTHRILIKSLLPDEPDELHQVAIERTCDSQEENRSGIIFRTMTGKTFFLGFERFSFYVPAAK